MTTNCTLTADEKRGDVLYNVLYIKQVYAYLITNSLKKISLCRFSCHNNNLSPFTQTRKPTILISNKFWLKPQRTLSSLCLCVCCYYWIWTIIVACHATQYQQQKTSKQTVSQQHICRTLCRTCAWFLAHNKAKYSFSQKVDNMRKWKGSKTHGEVSGF